MSWSKVNLKKKNKQKKKNVLNKSSVSGLDFTKKNLPGELHLYKQIDLKDLVKGFAKKKKKVQAILDCVQLIHNIPWHQGKRSSGCLNLGTVCRKTSAWLSSNG